jgi:hypothetical protein
VTYLTAWTNHRGEVNFRPDIYELDGTGFVLGQPLPVGEVAEDGQRYVLSPVPRQPAAVEEAEADGFFLFGLKPAKRSNAKKVAATEDKKEDPALFDWLQPKPAKKKPVKAEDGKKKPKAVAEKEIVKQEEQAVAAKKVEPPSAKPAELPAEECKSAVLGGLLEECQKPDGTAANSD